MGFTHTLGQTYRTAAGTISSTTDSYNGEAEVNLEATIAGNANNAEYDIAFDPAVVKSMVLFSNRAVTIRTNNSAAPIDTIVLAANKAVIWNTDKTEVIPFNNATPIDKFFITGDGNNNAALKAYFLCDPTP